MTAEFLSRHGPADAPTLLFLHGSGVSREAWTPHVDALTTEYHCVTLDFSGHGRHADGSFSYEKAVDTIAQALDAVGPAALIGHSMGGYTAMMAAEDHADRITGLCLAGAATNWRSRYSPQQEPPYPTLTRGITGSPIIPPEFLPGPVR